MKRAYVGIREAPVYRRDAFVAGLKARGYEVCLGTPQAFDADTVFVCWNRYHENHAAATQLENAGGAVLIAENGYLLPGGGSPHHQPVREQFALARGYHNDESVVVEFGSSRWDALGVDLKPWRTDGGHILICPNRSFGTPGRYMPIGWAEDVAARLKRITKREIRIRPHPGNSAPAKPLAEDLAGAWLTVIWQSSAGVHSLVAGVPVICESPWWICKSAAAPVLHADSIGLYAELPDRLQALRRLAWANWSLAEIQSGEAFGHLLRRSAQVEVRAAD